MAKLGFFGLGIMGAPMARHLLEAGHNVALWSNTSANAEKLAGAGDAIVCRTPAAVALQGGECLFVCVGVLTPLTAMSADLLKSAIVAGYGEQDICASIQVLQRTAHVEVIASPPMYAPARAAAGLSIC